MEAECTQTDGPRDEQATQLQRAEPGEPPPSISGKNLRTSRRNVSGSKTTPTASLKINCSRQPAEDDQPQFTR
jgi:hypothetical protein